MKGQKHVHIGLFIVLFVNQLLRFGYARLIKFIVRGLMLFIERNVKPVFKYKSAVAVIAFDKVHCGRAYKGCHKRVGGVRIHLFWRANLLNVALFHYDYAGSHCHRLCLVVSNVYGGRVYFFVKVDNFAPHGNAQLRIEVGKRLVHQKHLCLPNNRPAKRHPLHLPAGKLLRPPLQIFRNLQNLRRALHTPVYFFLAVFSCLQAECKIFVYRHMRI